MSKSDVFARIIDWATVRNIIDGGATIGQVGKFNEEVGETQEGLIRKNVPNTLDAVGDCLVIMTNVLKMESWLPERVIDLNARPLKMYADLNANTIICGINARWGTYWWQDATVGCADDELDEVVEFILPLLAELARRNDFTLEQAIEHSYGVIKDRVGVYYNDVFIKEEDFTTDLLGQVARDESIPLEVRCFAQLHLEKLIEKEQALNEESLSKPRPESE